MPWNYMQIEIIPEDALARPMIGEGNLTREAAHAEILSILTRAQDLNPPLFANVVRMWKRGAQDDTCNVGPFTWTIYEYREGDDPRREALVWIEDFAQIIRNATGINVRVAKMPDPK